MTRNGQQNIIYSKVIFRPHNEEELPVLPQKTVFNGKVRRVIACHLLWRLNYSSLILSVQRVPISVGSDCNITTTDNMRGSCPSITPKLTRVCKLIDLVGLSSLTPMPVDCLVLQNIGEFDSVGKGCFHGLSDTQFDSLFVHKKGNFFLHRSSPRTWKTVGCVRMSECPKSQRNDYFQICSVILSK